MNRSLRLLSVAVLLAVAGAALSLSHAPRNHARGAYLYLDAAGRPLNSDDAGVVVPLASGDSALVASRSFVDFGDAGTADAPGNGAYCALPEACTTRRVAETPSRFDPEVALCGTKSADPLSE